MNVFASFAILIDGQTWSPVTECLMSLCVSLLGNQHTMSSTFNIISCIVNEPDIWHHFLKYLSSRLLDLQNLRLTCRLMDMLSNITPFTKSSIMFGVLFRNSAYNKYYSIDKLDLRRTFNLKQIGDFSFNGLGCLTHLLLSDCSRLLKIGRHAFCSSPLKKIDLRGCSNLRKIGQYAFNNSKTIPDFSDCDSLENVGVGAFYGTTISGAIKLNESLLHIGKDAFRQAQFTSVVIHHQIRKIGSYSFMYSRLTSLILTNCVDLLYIGRNAFKESMLKTICLAGCRRLHTIDDYAFVISQVDYLDFSGCYSLRKIGESAFLSALLTQLDLSNCPKLCMVGAAAFLRSPLTSLNLPKSLTVIERDAFINYTRDSVDLSNCSSLAIVGQDSFPCSTSIAYPDTRKDSLYMLHFEE